MSDLEDCGEAPLWEKILILSVLFLMTQNGANDPQLAADKQSKAACVCAADER